MNNNPTIERLARAKVYKARQKRQALFSFGLLLVAIAVHFLTHHCQVVLGPWTSLPFAAIRALFYGLALLSICTFIYVFVTYSSSSSSKVSKVTATKSRATVNRESSAILDSSVLKGGKPASAAPAVTLTTTKAVYTGPLPPNRQQAYSTNWSPVYGRHGHTNSSTMKACADNPRNYIVGGAMNDNLFGETGAVGGGAGDGGLLAYPPSAAFSGALYTGGMVTPAFPLIRHSGTLSPSMVAPHSTSKFNTSSIVGMNSTPYGSGMNNNGSGMNNNGGKYLSPPVNDINSPGKYLSDIVGGTGRRHTPNAHDYIKSHDAMTYLDDMGCVHGEWLSSAKHVILQHLVQAHSEFSGSVNDIMLHAQQRNLAMHFFPGATNTIKDQQDFYNKVRSVLMLDTAKCDIATSAGVADITLQSLCRRLEDSDINIDKSSLHAYYYRYTIFCSPAVASELLGYLSANTGSSSSKVGSKIGSHSAEVIDLIRVMHSKNWKSTSSIDSELIVSVFLNICSHSSSSHSYSYNSMHNSSTHLSTKYFASSVGDIKGCALGEHSCGLVRQAAGSSRQVNYNVYVVDGHHIDIVTIDAGRDNCYEGIVTLLLMIIKFNTVVREPVHQFMRNVFSEFHYIRDYPGLRHALESRGLFLRYVDDDEDD